MGSEQSHELHKNASDAATRIEVCSQCDCQTDQAIMFIKRIATLALVYYWNVFIHCNVPCGK